MYSLEGSVAFKKVGKMIEAVFETQADFVTTDPEVGGQVFFQNTSRWMMCLERNADLH